jgi:hypothetical protein
VTFADLRTGGAGSPEIDSRLFLPVVMKDDKAFFLILNDLIPDFALLKEHL